MSDENQLTVDSVEIMGTQVARLEEDEERGIKPIPVFVTTVRLGNEITPRQLFWDREQLIRLRDEIDRQFRMSDSWLHTPKTEQKRLRFQSPNLEPPSK